MNQWTRNIKQVFVSTSILESKGGTDCDLQRTSLCGSTLLLPGWSFPSHQGPGWDLLRRSAVMKLTSPPPTPSIFHSFSVSVWVRRGTSVRFSSSSSDSERLTVNSVYSSRRLKGEYLRLSVKSSSSHPETQTGGVCCRGARKRVEAVQRVRRGKKGEEKEEEKKQTVLNLKIGLWQKEAKSLPPDLTCANPIKEGSRRHCGSCGAVNNVKH